MNDEETDDHDAALLAEPPSDAGKDEPGRDDDDDARDADADADDAVDRRPSPYRQSAFAVARAVVVLAAAVVGYQAVIPSTHVVRARLARLALTEPGVAGYNVKPAQAAEQPAAQTQLPTVVAAAKRAPDATGVYSIDWTPSQSLGALLVVYLLPTDADATSAFSELRTQQLASTSGSASGLTRRSTFAVDGVPGSAGSLFAPSAGGSSATTRVAVTALREGRAVALSEVVGTTRSQADASVLAVNEYARLRQVASGFSLKVVNRPVVASLVWAGGSVAVAAAVALGPIVRRRAARRRQRRIEEELSRRVVVHGQVITKHRR